MSFLVTRARILCVEEVLESYYVQWQCPIPQLLSLEVIYSTDEVDEVDGLIEANTKALLRMLAVEDPKGGSGAGSNTPKRGDAMGPKFRSRLRGRPVLVFYHLPQPDRADADSPGALSSPSTAGLLLAHHKVIFPSHEELLQTLHKLLRLSPSLVSADVYKYIQDCGVDVQVAMRMSYGNPVPTAGKAQ